MRRAGLAVTFGLALAALVAPVVSAHAQTTSFVAKSSSAAPTEVLNVLAKVKHATRGSAFSATAVVHFADGAVTISLTNHGRSFTAGGGALVPADQPVGPVGVDVTITYNAVAQPTISFQAKVEPAGD